MVTCRRETSLATTEGTTRGTDPEHCSIAGHGRGEPLRHAPAGVALRRAGQPAVVVAPAPGPGRGRVGRDPRRPHITLRPGRNWRSTAGQHVRWAYRSGPPLTRTYSISSSPERATAASRSRSRCGGRAHVRPLVRTSRSATICHRPPAGDFLVPRRRRCATVITGAARHPGHEHAPDVGIVGNMPESPTSTTRPPVRRIFGLELQRLASTWRRSATRPSTPARTAKGEQ